MAMNFTARGLAKLKPADEAYYVVDRTGLALRISTTGQKTWSLRYRVGRVQRRITFGDHPTLSLADARKRVRAALKQVEDGIDPQEVKQTRRDALTVAEFARTYVDEHAKIHKRSWKADDRRLRLDVVPAWKHRLMTDIGRDDVSALLKTIATRAPIVANRVRSLLHKVFAFAIEERVVALNPVTATRKLGKEHARDRVLTHEELRRFWSACSRLPVPMATFYRLRLLTAARGGEVSSMCWQDVDLDDGWWTIPAGGSKNKLSHRVPLSVPVVAMLAELLATADYKAVFVFGANARRSGQGARGKRQQAEAATSFGIPDFRGHDLRRTAASLMTGSGVSRLTVSKILNHAESGVTAVYDRHGYDQEKRIALDAWARTLQQIVEPRDATVLPFATRG